VGKRILIADDGEEVRQVVRAIFEARTSYEICGEAGNGLEAVEKTLELKPDLVLLDVAMPMLNGVEVASVLARHMPKLPIVLYTSTLCTMNCWGYPWPRRWEPQPSYLKQRE